MSRRLAREELFKLVFEGEIKEENTKDILESYLNREEILQNENEIAFIKKYMNGITENNDKILKVIEEKITGWSFERIGNVEKALLKISVYEILCEDTPYEIVINEAVELAKIYGDEKTSEFLNGVLAKIVNN
ncbi:MAG: transcription antitermination factor NusB [Fusobacterium varium]|uniref:transcription antitermination factor NusB n=1 Tax=Fusobacterium varium TaxID=856 RepID=UPI00242D0E9F|nr:transcription antitermination factor NusB [Fusobacterium varium]MCF0170872.1 transcription antitermination factor NusB [Fusobacterium varium]